MFTRLQSALGRLRIVGILEALSFIVLLGIAMPLKYFAGEPAAVRVVGMVHGALFLLTRWQFFRRRLSTAGGSGLSSGS